MDGVKEEVVVVVTTGPSGVTWKEVVEVGRDEDEAGEPAPGVALGVADDDVDVAPPRPNPPPIPPNALPTPPPKLAPKPPVTLAPTPSVPDKLRSRPDEPRLTPTPAPACTESETPRVAETLTSTIVLFEGPATPTPLVMPTPGVARMQALRILPPFVQVIGGTESEVLIVGKEVVNKSMLDNDVENGIEAVLELPERLSGSEIEIEGSEIDG